MTTVVPEWNPANCIQCNQCSLVCPHAAIRPCVMTDEEMKKAPESMKAIDVKMPNVVQSESRGSLLTMPIQSNVTEGKGLAGMHFRMQVSAMDCTGCGNCADVCADVCTAIDSLFGLTADRNKLINDTTRRGGSETRCGGSEIRRLLI